MNDRLEPIIIAGLIYNDAYCRKVLPYLKGDFFENPAERLVFEKVDKLFAQYNQQPTRETLLVSINKEEQMPEALYPKVKELVEGLKPLEPNSVGWLTNQTETFCKDKSLHLAIIQSIEILDGDDKTHSKDALPQILQNALAVGFDSNVGLIYTEADDQMYDHYHLTEKKIPFKLKMLNAITNGGIAPKTLTVLMMPTGAGKSLFMCDWSAFLYMNGYNVLYISAEMAEVKLGERIDQNLLNLTNEEVRQLTKLQYMDKKAKLRASAHGNILTREYPTSTCHTGHFRALLAEAKIKKNFVPDIIFVDYLNICASQRFKMNGSVNSYTYMKAIAEELRGLAVEYNVPVVTATQVNRTGYADTDFDLDDTSESFGVPFTADLMLAGITTEDLERLGQLMFKQLKNRYGDPNLNKRFLVGANRAKMQLYDLEQSAALMGANSIKNQEDSVRADKLQDKFFKKPEPTGSFTGTEAFSDFKM